jgi:RNA polymerase sigma factor (sigma-70 family)
MASDSEAFDKLFELYFERLAALARKMLRNSPVPSDGEDVAASALRSFWKGIQRGRIDPHQDQDDLLKLLMKITINKSIDVYNNAIRHPRDRSIALEEILDSGPNEQSLVTLNEQYQRLLARLGSDLPRQVAAARLEGFTREEIADQVGCSIRKVATILKFIRETWEQELSH